MSRIYDVIFRLYPHMLYIIFSSNIYGWGWAAAIKHKWDESCKTFQPNSWTETNGKFLWAAFPLDAYLEILANPCWGITELAPKMGKTKGIPPRMAFFPSNTLFFDTKSCSWLLTRQLTMVQPCRLMVHIVLLPRSIITTGTWDDMAATAVCLLCGQARRWSCSSCC